MPRNQLHAPPWLTRGREGDSLCALLLMCRCAACPRWSGAGSASTPIAVCSPPTPSRHQPHPAGCYPLARIVPATGSLSQMWRRKWPLFLSLAFPLITGPCATGDHPLSPPPPLFITLLLYSCAAAAAGFETVTIAFQGEVEHGDSVGNRGVIGPGDVQWMRAARGIIHEEFHSTDFSKKVQQPGPSWWCWWLLLESVSLALV